MPTPAYWLYLVGAYLAGSIPFALLLGLMKGVDIRKVGSGNVGATNLGRACGRGFGIAGFALDVLKGLVPVLMAGQFTNHGEAFLPEPAPWQAGLLWISIGVSAVLGHVYSLWLGFKGGKGVATSLGVLLGFFPLLTLAGGVGGLLWLAACFFSGYVSLASVVAAVSVPVTTLLAWRLLPESETRYHDDPWVFGTFTVLLAALVIVKHRSNMVRLRAGTESKAGWTLPGRKAKAG